MGVKPRNGAPEENKPDRVQIKALKREEKGILMLINQSWKRT